MKIKFKSYFKDERQDLGRFEKWVELLETNNGKKYERLAIQTSLGKTHVWGLNAADNSLETLIIFPGARTTALIWDFDNGLSNLNQTLRIFLVETNGLPNFSEGNTPDIKSLDYGWWADEVFEKLGIEKAFVAGASFGGLICMKLAIVKPERIKAAFLLNPGCLQPFSLALSNLYYNLLPVIFPNQKTVSRFLDKAVFSKANHQLSAESEKMLIDYEVFALTRYKDNTQKPYYMDKQLTEVKADTFLLVGDRDPLFPFQKSVENAKKHISTLKDIKVFKDVGHGIETYDKAMRYVGEKIESYRGL
jgi:esterase/lipase